MPTPSTPQSTDLHAKALAINLEASIYGTFAEIGAGQEVARWFLSVGAASGTVAQAISAYDKTVSDDTYGAGTRYVSKERLLAMLDHEFELLVSRLDKERGARTRFFVFADTIATRNYQGTNQQHGWLGMRFQAEPGGRPNHIVLHINLGDPLADLQQQAIGILGVNLIYAAYHQRGSSEAFLTGLFEGLSRERIDIDVLDLSGPAFAGVDSRLWSLELLSRDMAEALVFDSKGQLVEPSTPLRKRPLLLQRTFLDPPGLFAAETFQAARKQFLAEGKTFEREPAVVVEISTRKPGGESPPIDGAELLGRVAKLAPLATVVVTQYLQGYGLVDYLRRYTPEPIRMVLSIAAIFRLWEEQIFTASPGALMETFGRILYTDVTIYVAPMAMEPFVAALGGMPSDFVVESAGSHEMTLEDFFPKPPLLHLFQYLRGAGRILPLAAPAKG
jgi:hypothetical protein